MTVSDELDHKVFALTGGMGDKLVYGIADERISKFESYIKAGEGATAAKIGHLPTHQYTEAKDATRNLERISSKEARRAVNKEIRNSFGKTGSAYKTMVNQMKSGTLKDLMGLPGRVAFTTMEANAAKGKTHALRKYLEMAVPYVNQHAGGIIGDTIKEEYFQAGRMKWPPLNPETIKKKEARNRKFKGRYPNPATPLFGTTFTATLPDGWKMYTYKWGDYPNKSPEALPHKALSTYMVAPGQTGTAGVRSSTGFFSEPYAMKHKGKETGAIAYPPAMRGRALMDIVAHLAPIAQVTQPYAGRGYQAALKAAAANPNTPGYGQMKIDGIVQPFYTAPYVFYHASGTSRVPKRSFIEEGLIAGMGRVEQLFNVYFEEGGKNFRKAYAETEFEEIKDMAEIEAFYRAGSDAMGDAARISKVKGMAGLRKEPRLSLYDHQLDNLLLKHTQMKSLIRKLFGNHLIWWFVPPSKYWHYIGMLSDIRGLFFGQKNIGTVRAYITAMTVGLAGARAGSPVPFTTKARRRKFRKSLYSRAGYHRTQVGGSR
jgi:hypothetical protein